MSKGQPFELRGVIPACLLPMNEDMSVDEAAYRAHLRDVVAVDGLSAITVNGHASEIHACTFDEQKYVLDVTMDEIGDRIPVIAGVYADGSQMAADIARMAQAGGASALLIFPPQSMSMGGQLRPEMAVAHFKAIAAASDLPMILFQYPASTGLSYPLDTLLKIFEAVPTVRAIKDWCNDPLLHEKHIHVLHSLDRPVNVLTTHSGWLMSSLVMGCDGLLSGAGSVIADLQVALWQAVQNDDLKSARAINDRMYPMVQAFYSPPFLDMHNRMKEALVLLGRQSKAVVRPPLMKVSDAEIARLRAAIADAGLSREGAFGALAAAE